MNTQNPWRPDWRHWRSNRYHWQPCRPYPGGFSRRWKRPRIRCRLSVVDALVLAALIGLAVIVRLL
jgi:hypothetical protein